MSVTAARQEIARIDREIDAISDDLRRRETIKLFSAESWQAAWDKHPDLKERDAALWKQRGQAQARRDEAEHQAAMAAARNSRPPRRKRCPTCGR